MTEPSTVIGNRIIEIALPSGWACNVHVAENGDGLVIKPEILGDNDLASWVDITVRSLPKATDAIGFSELSSSHPKKLTLYKVEIGGVAYWVAASRKAALSTILSIIRRSEDLDQFEEEDLADVEYTPVSKEGSEPAWFHADDGSRIPMWEAFLEVEDASVVACSEW